MPHAMSRRGERIAYRVVEPEKPSTLPPVVLVQGLGLSGRFWFDIPERIATHATEARRVIVIDNVGTGRSDKAHGLRSIASMGDDIVAVLDDLGEPQAVLCGISMGGMISQEAALRHPRRIRGLVLIATTPGLPVGSLPGVKALQALVRLPFEPRDGGKMFVFLLLPRAQWSRAREIFADWSDAFRADRTPPSVFFRQLLAVAFHSTGSRLRDLRIPVMVMTGTEDILVPPINSRKIANRVPNADLELLPGVGHAVPVLDRDVVVRGLAALGRMSRELAEKPAPAARASGFASTFRLAIPRQSDHSAT
jgi:pimeloyl-ACP methyl ester carboxylesterase